MTTTQPRADLYRRVTDRIVADLEQGVRTWLKPWSVAHTEGRITRPLRHNGIPCSGVNVLLLWAEAVERSFASPSSMTFKQAHELGAHIRKGERGSMVVSAKEPGDLSAVMVEELTAHRTAARPCVSNSPATLP